MNIGQSTEFTFLLETDSQGKARIKNRAEFDEFLRQLPNQKFEVNVRALIGSDKAKKNAQYWVAVVEPIRREFRIHGEIMTKKQVHEFLKSQNPDMQEVVNTSTGTKHINRSLADCNDAEISNHIQFVIQWASENMGLELDI